MSVFHLHDRVRSHCVVYLHNRPKAKVDDALKGFVEDGRKMLLESFAMLLSVSYNCNCTYLSLRQVRKVRLHQTTSLPYQSRYPACFLIYPPHSGCVLGCLSRLYRPLLFLKGVTRNETKFRDSLVRGVDYKIAYWTSLVFGLPVRHRAYSNPRYRSNVVSKSFKFFFLVFFFLKSSLISPQSIRLPENTLLFYKFYKNIGAEICETLRLYYKLTGR